VTEGKLGKVRELRSSAEISKAEMTEAIERFRNWSSVVASIHLPAPNEHEFLKHIEQQSKLYT